MAKTNDRKGIVRAIAVFRLAKSALLIAFAVGALQLLHRGAARAAQQWIEALPSDIEHRWLRETLARALAASPHKKELVAAAALVYAALFAVEGVGLWLDRLWAEYLTIIATSSFIPFEIYEVARRVSPLRVGALVANVAIVVYLVIRVRHRRRTIHA
ncbi:MAG TPA: DUF2127 domain-containing protein [Thermoanaerobaculia bacterium]|jgi:uncharacterized membrane protein (DUF2068 family)